METLIGLLIIAGNTFASLYLFGVGKETPEWILIIVGILNFTILLSILWITKK